MTKMKTTRKPERMFTSVEFDIMVNWIGVNTPPVTVPTLGGRSFITANCPNAKTIHITGSTGRTRDFNENYWRKISRIIDTAERPWMTSTYTDKTVPDYFFAPSVPALCKAYFERN